MPVESESQAVDCAVIIVGAGPVGLALGIELGTRGVHCVILERNDRVGHAPRAKTTNVRTRTHLRRWGIADRLAEASPFGVHYPSNVIFTTRLAGFELARFTDAFNAAPEPNVLYPEHAQWIPQYKLEEILRQRAASLPTVRLRFNTELTSFEEADGSITTTCRAGDGARLKIRARYLVGADGARSIVREQIGASMSGRHGLSSHFNTIFRAPGLSRAHAHGPAIMYWQVNADLPSVVGPMDRDELWFISLPAGSIQEHLADAKLSELIRRATGIQLPYEILSSDHWTASCLIADRYRAGNVFLAGDACHLHPPFGGYGMNMGVGDGVDLGWKLAAVLQGWGGEGLLDTYEAERKPVHGWIMDEAAANHAVLGRELFQAGLEEPGLNGEVLRRQVGENILRLKGREFQTLGAVLGYGYRSPTILSEEPACERPDAGTYRPTSSPGYLAPHVWASPQVSLYDQFGPGFTLLARELEPARMALREARAMAIPMALVMLPGNATASLYPKRLTLVRPDQHVSWRGDHWDPGVLKQVAGKGRRESPRHGE